MDDKQYKIIKKHLKTRDFDSDVYILKYRFPIFHFCAEYPIYFTNENILKDFVESAYLFNFNFVFLHDKSNYIGTEHCIRCFKRGFNIYLSTKKVIHNYILEDWTNNFTILETEYENDAPRYYGKKLSDAYNAYINSTRVGLSESLEEKIYKLTCE